MIRAGRFRAAGKIDKIGQNIQAFLAARIDYRLFGIASITGQLRISILGGFGCDFVSQR